MIKVGKIRIAYIPQTKVLEHQKKGLKWGADIMFENLKKSVSPDFKLIPHHSLENFPEAEIFHFHNVNSTIPRRQFFGRTVARKYLPQTRRSVIAELVESNEGTRIAGGIRGWSKIEETDMLKHFHAIHVGNSRMKEVITHPNVFVCHAGIDRVLFSPSDEKPESFSICWAGDSEKEVKNYELLKDLGFNLKTATRKNFRPHNEMPDFYRSSCVYVNLSSSEGFCRPIVEAAACGLPVVSTNTGVAPELLGPHWIVDEAPKGPGVIKKFQEKIQALKEDPEMAWTVGRQNRERTAQFSWSQVAKQFEDMWYSLVKS